MQKRTWIGAVALVLCAACAGDADTAADAGAPADSPAPAAPAAPATPPPAAPAAPAGGASALPEGVTQDMVTAGQQVFNSTTCFTCHGQNGVGGPLAPALNDQTWLNTDGTFDGIMQVVRTGVPTPKEHQAPMPAMGGAPLTDDQVRQVSAYVYSISRGG